LSGDATFLQRLLWRTLKVISQPPSWGSWQSRVLSPAQADSFGTPSRMGRAKIDAAQNDARRVFGHA